MPVYDYILPSLALREYVKLYNILACEFPASMVELPVKAYWPRSENCLTFLPKDPEKIGYNSNGKLLESSRARLVGQHSESVNIHVGRNFMVFNVVFQPGALFRLTGIPQQELANSFVDAEAVFSKEIRQVNERLSYTRQYTEMVDIVENFLGYLVNRARKPSLPIDKVSYLLQANPSQFSLDWLAEQACLSQRQFSRQFVQRQGISPRLFARIARFENAMKIKNARPSSDWLTLALELGYVDYQHLAKDFKEFTGVTPTAYYEASAKGPERAFGMAESY